MSCFTHLARCGYAVAARGLSIWSYRLPAGFPAAVLLCCTFVDELLAGIPVVGLPLIRDGLALSYGQAGLLLSIGGMAGMIVEPVLFAHTDGRPRYRVALWATLGLAACELFSAVTPGFALLLLAMAISGPLGGLALGMAQASLIEAKTASSQRTMMRWMLMGSLGDLLAPMLVAGMAAATLSWRMMFAVSGLTWLFYAMAQIRWPHRPVGPERVAAAEASAGQGRWAGVMAAVRHPELLRWAVLLELLCLLDEVLVGFASLYLTDVLGASVPVASAAVGAAMAATVVSLPFWGRLAGRVEAGRLLRAMSLGVLAGLALVLVARTGWWAAVGLVVMNAAGGGLYPIMKTQAYRLFPGQSGTMLAALACFAPISAALPWLLGMVAKHAGLPVALGMTGLAPLGVLLFAPGRSDNHVAQARLSPGRNRGYALGPAPGSAGSGRRCP